MIYFLINLFVDMVENISLTSVIFILLVLIRLNNK